MSVHEESRRPDATSCLATVPLISVIQFNPSLSSSSIRVHDKLEHLPRVSHLYIYKDGEVKLENSPEENV